MSASRIALVTGASQGIGAAAAEALASHGWQVVVAARSTDKLQEVASRIDGDCLAVPCDVSEPDDVTRLFEAVTDRWGRLDLLFNNAGVNIPPTEVGSISWEDWRRVVGINLDGAFLVASAAFRMMKGQDPRGGRIINNGSVSAHTPRINSAAYTASKHAISGLTKSIALDGRQHDIACGQIDIGNAGGGMLDNTTGPVPQADGSMKQEARMSGEQVAAAVAHMASLPLEANIQTMTIMATKMPFIGRG